MTRNTMTAVMVLAISLVAVFGIYQHFNPQAIQCREKGGSYFLEGCVKFIMVPIQLEENKRE